MRLLLGFLLLTNVVFAQYPLENKRDHIWMFGYENSPPNFGGTSLDFNQNPPLVTYVSQQISLDDANASICDHSGNLLMYTNAMYVANANHQIMPHGDSINYGDLYNYFDYYGYIMPQGALILPLPGSESLYYLFHEKLEWSQPYFDLPMGFYCSIIDLSLDSGLGDVVEKNVILINDTLDYGCITATRHANGRDWWILVPEFFHNRYYRLLLTPQGVVQDTMQTIGTASFYPELAQACFSPDGTKYVRWGGVSLNSPDRLEVYNFDRCTGTLSGYQNLWHVDTVMRFGVAISPNSKYLYVSAEYRIDQYDLQASDIALSKQTVAVYDGFADPLFPLGKTMFSLEQLAPDNKIYITPPNGTRFLHVIDQPNNEGMGCNVLQHAIQLNTFNARSIPNFPNFRLGPIDGSICDSLGIDIINSNTDIKINESSFVIWPNPASQYFNYKFEVPETMENYLITLTDNVGRMVQSWPIQARQSMGNFNINGLQPGAYLVTLQSEQGKILGKKKLLIIR